jgi:hypothetical protein
MNHAKTSVSTEMFAGAIISVVQYLAPLRYMFCCSIEGRSDYSAALFSCTIFMQYIRKISRVIRCVMALVAAGRLQCGPEGYEPRVHC